MSPPRPLPRGNNGDPPEIAIRIVDIKGLYLPGHASTAPRPEGTTRAAGYAPGYKSLDNQGRIFLNQDLDGRWKSDMQLIEVTVEVSGGDLPEGAVVRWRPRDVDDPFNERPEVHPAWGPTIDGNDYDASGAYIGPVGNDNEGSLRQSPRWEQVEGYALDAADGVATTAIVQRTSKVRHHTTDVAGDNFILRVELTGADGTVIASDETGIMTLWHRVDVELVRMESAPRLPVEEVPARFEPAFTQLDFTVEQVVPDRQYIALSLGALGPSASRFVADVFTHRGEPGWFCLVAALEPHPLPDRRGEVLYKGPATIEEGGEDERRGEYIDIPGHHDNAAYVTIRWDGNTVGFEVATATAMLGPPDVTRLWLQPHDVQPNFTAGDGSVAHAYKDRVFFYPRSRRVGDTFEGSGYGAPKQVEIAVQSEGAFYTAGMSPTIDLGNMRYFAGRTILFTRHGAWWNRRTGGPRSNYRDAVLHTIVHELVHAFGMPHKCGHFDYRTPRVKTCCMNYAPNWMVDDSLELIPGTSERVGDDMCGRHIKEVRRVHLEDNKGLRWK